PGADVARGRGCAAQHVVFKEAAERDEPGGQATRLDRSRRHRGAEPEVGGVPADDELQQRSEARGSLDRAGDWPREARVAILDIPETAAAGFPKRICASGLAKARRG